MVLGGVWGYVGACLGVFEDGFSNIWGGIFGGGRHVFFPYNTAGLISLLKGF